MDEFSNDKKIQKISKHIHNLLRLPCDSMAKCNQRMYKTLLADAQHVEIFLAVSHARSWLPFATHFHPPPC